MDCSTHEACYVESGRNGDKVQSMMDYGTGGG